MTRGNTEHLSDRTLRRQVEFARQTRPALSVEESSRLDRICQRLTDIEDFEREQVALLEKIVKCMADACEHDRANDRLGERLDAIEQRRGLTRPGPNLHLVRE